MKNIFLIIALLSSSVAIAQVDSKTRLADLRVIFSKHWNPYKANVVKFNSNVQFPFESNGTDGEIKSYWVKSGQCYFVANRASRGKTVKAGTGYRISRILELHNGGERVLIYLYAIGQRKPSPVGVVCPHRSMNSTVEEIEKDIDYSIAIL